jgi:hypothetical protein
LDLDFYMDKIMTNYSPTCTTDNLNKSDVLSTSSIITRKNKTSQFYTLSSGLKNYKKAINLQFKLPTSIYGCMLVIWQLRVDLRQKFPLQKQKKEDYINFLAWCATYGRQEYGILLELAEWENELNSPISLPKLKHDIWSSSFNVAMFLAAIARSNYYTSPVLSNIHKRRETSLWYWDSGRASMKLPSPPTWQLSQLINQFKSFDNFLNQFQNTKLLKKPICTEAIIKQNNALANAFKFYSDHNHEIPDNKLHEFDLKSIYSTFEPSFVSKHFEALVSYITTHSKFIRKLKYLLVRKFYILNTKKRLNENNISTVVNKISLTRTSLHCEVQRNQFGVNLYGYANGELGIGEDVRMLAHSLQEAKIPFCVINIKLHQSISQKDKSVNQWLSNEPKYYFNIFCATAIEHSRLITKKGLSIMQGRYNIGLWPWELPHWPSSWHHAYNLVNEIWGISEYTAKSFQSANVPVRTMPLPVELCHIAKLKRCDFNLPSKAYLFIFSFDFNSTITRKNPTAVLSAFQKAFPEETAEQVGMVLKISHANHKSKRWRKIKRLINKDKRIYLIEKEFRKSEVLSLYKCCDCYVSLHRAEGFGRGIAEAMLLGMEIITTGYSGNLNFCNQDSVHLVNYQLRYLKKYEYFHYENQQWAEPDVSHASKLMQKVYKQKAQEIKHNGMEQFSYSFCGSAYKERLQEIFNTTSQLIDISPDIKT